VTTPHPYQDAERLADEKPARDSAADAARWLAHPEQASRKESRATQLAAEPEWRNDDEESNKRAGN
jgi:hypothetical protein